VVVQDGKVPGDVPGNTPPSNAPRQKHKRHVTNYLLDKKLQLRYVILVTALSAVISGVLGFMIYQQMHLASQDVAANLEGLDDGDDDFQKQITDDMERRDRRLIYEMAAVGIGLVVILSAYLVVMTHKVAGPLYKVSHYFDKMAAGQLGNVTPLRRGDMLTDFYDGFKVMHEAVRKRQKQDNASMQVLVDACAAAGVDSKAITQLAKHVEERKKALA
jgi:hypothetical protein